MDLRPGGFGLGEMRRYQRETAKARLLLDEALQLARTAGDRKTEADALSSRAGRLRLST